MASFCYDCCLELFCGTEEEALENDFAGIVRGNERYFCLCVGVRLDYGRQGRKESEEMINYLFDVDGNLTYAATDGQ